VRRSGYVTRWRCRVVRAGPRAPRCSTPDARCDRHPTGGVLGEGPQDAPDAGRARTGLTPWSPRRAVPHPSPLVCQPARRPARRAPGRATLGRGRTRGRRGRAGRSGGSGPSPLPALRRLTREKTDRVIPCWSWSAPTLSGHRPRPWPVASGLPSVRWPRARWATAAVARRPRLSGTAGEQRTAVSSHRPRGNPVVGRRTPPGRQPASGRPVPPQLSPALGQRPRGPRR